MYELKLKGLSYQDIADVCGLSKQCVHKKVGSYGRKLAGIRGQGFDINAIVFKGIYEHFEDNFDETLHSFSYKVVSNNPKFVDRFKRLIKGENDVKLTIPQIKKICQVIGKPFEEVFEERVK